MCSVYVASRTKHAKVWRSLRNDKFPIISTWIDEAEQGQTKDVSQLWSRIVEEITLSVGLVLYIEPDDFPLKGAFVEVGIALGLNKRIGLVASKVKLDDNFRPIGSWMKHPLVRNCYSVTEAFMYAEGMHI